MSVQSILACLAAIVHLQACDQPASDGARAAPQPPAATAARPVRREKADALSTAEENWLDLGIVPAAAPPYAVDPWSGFYLAGALGYGSADSEQTYIRAGDHGTASVSPGGFAASLLAGYDLHLTPAWLVGLQAEIGIMDLSEDDRVVYDGHVWKPQFGPLWGTLRARAGWLMGDSTLLYATGGLAFMQTDNWTLGNTAPETSWDAKMRTGWTLGAGVEYAVTPAWHATAEFLYMDFGTHKGFSANREPYSFDDDVVLFRLGIARRF